MAASSLWESRCTGPIGLPREPASKRNGNRRTGQKTQSNLLVKKQKLSGEAGDQLIQKSGRIDRLKEHEVEKLV